MRFLTAAVVCLTGVVVHAEPEESKATESKATESQSNGRVRAETRKLSPFSALEVGGGFEVLVRDGNPSVTIEADENLLPLIKTEVTQNTLVISARPRHGFHFVGPVKLTVTTRPLQSVSANGGVDLRFEAATEKRFTVELSGGVQFSAQQLQPEALTFRANGGVEATLAGAVSEANLDVSGGVTLKANALSIQHASLDASGGCDVSLKVRQRITGEASGGVNVTVAGAPSIARVETSGGADVHYQR
jgi:hypothetical protein